MTWPCTSPVGVIIEVKGPKNTQEMLTRADLNRNAFQQLLCYYLEDRSDDRADDFQRLVVTTGYEWCLSDAQYFNALFWKNTELRRTFKDFKSAADTRAADAFVAALYGLTPAGVAQLGAAGGG